MYISDVGGHFLPLEGGGVRMDVRTCTQDQSKTYTFLGAAKLLQKPVVNLMIQFLMLHAWKN